MRPAQRQFVMFLLVGGLAAGVNVGSRVLLGHWIPYVPSILVAFCLGLATGFLLNKIFVFDGATNRLHHQILWFVGVNLAAAVQTILISLLLAKWILPALGIDFHNETLAHSFGVVVPVVTSYLGHKHFSFK